MRNCHRWTALVSAAVLSLSGPVQVFADEATQGGLTMDTAVLVPSSGLEEPQGAAVLTGGGNGATVSAGIVESSVGSVFTGGGSIDSGGGSVAAGSGTQVNTALPGTGGLTEGMGASGTTKITESAGTAGAGSTTGGTDTAGTVNMPGNTGSAGTVNMPGNTGSAGTVNVPGNTSSAGTANVPGQDAAGNENMGTETPVDFSKGPGFFQEKKEEPQPAGVPAQQPVEVGEVLPVQNPVQILPSQPIRGIIAQDGTVVLADVANSIVQVADKYSYDQMILDMSLLKVRYGDKIHIREMGESLDNRKLYDCIVGNVNAPKHILIQGGIHAREYMNPLLMMQQIELILANYDTGTFHGMTLREMFNYVAVHFVPMTNPDGIAISQFGPEAIRSAQLREEINQCYVSDLARGKASLDTASYYSRWKANARGVDLNLNFDALWEEIGASVPSSNGFRGLTPASEPETQAMINLYNNPEYSWAAVLHYHSMGNVIYWDIRGNKVQAQSLELAQLMSNVTGGYRILPSTGGGGFKDWIQLSEHPVPSVTLETGSVACPIPVTYYGEIWNKNCLTWAYAMEWAAVH